MADSSLRVWRLPVDAHPGIRAIYDLVRLKWPVDERDVIGDLRADLAAGPPAVDQPEDLSRDVHRVALAHDSIARAVRRFGWQTGCALHYSAGGGLGWHTNSSRPGWRVYVPFQHEPGQSGLITEMGFFPDVNGRANMFRLGPGAWHAVWAGVPRTSFGAIITDDLAALALTAFLSPLVPVMAMPDVGPPRAEKTATLPGLGKARTNP